MNKLYASTTATLRAHAERAATVELLRIKDADARIAILEQARDAVDKGVHAGGALSAIIPLVALYFGGVINVNIDDPADTAQDNFILSKGHAVAAAAAVFAEIGLFEREHLKGSRGIRSILNGHPGPILRGFPISTGPMGQGLSVAVGMAIAGRDFFGTDTFCLCGDGELQEGNIWEGVMYAGAQRVENLCVIVDHNHGQLDTPRQLHYTPVSIAAQFASFGWRTVTIDGTQYGAVLDALNEFKYGPRDGQPTVIVAKTKKGFGGFSDFLVGHKVTMPDKLVEQEIALQRAERARHVEAFQQLLGRLGGATDELAAVTSLAQRAQLAIAGGVVRHTVPHAVEYRRPAVRDKMIKYDGRELPQLDPTKSYVCSDVVSQAMRVFARDPRVVSIDSDLSSTSGLAGGVGYVDQRRALNVGIAEANMMCIGEGYAALGFNTWVSTFCPFFNLNVLRRIAISQQERLEAIELPEGWLNNGHELDLTFLATAANFDTRTNGATHMGNDDSLIFGEIAHLKIIDISCPNQMLAVMKWIMAGNKGLVYVRIMRAGSPVLYPTPPEFEYGRGYLLRSAEKPQAVIVSAGRQVHESVTAAELLAARGVQTSVVDMPSFDAKMALEVLSSGALLVLAEQNNGYLYRELQKAGYRAGIAVNPDQVLAVNTLTADGQLQFIHSGEYGELIDHFGLAPAQLAERVGKKLASR